MELNEIITLVVQSLLVPLAIWGITVASNYVKSRVKSAQLEQALIMADSAIRAAVLETSQVFVDELKKNGEFTPEQARIAAGKAFDRAVQIMGERGVELLVKVTGDAKAYIESKIEEAVRDNHIPAELFGCAEAKENVPIGFHCDS